ncbi:hypothetical protein ACIBG5_43055 [Kribbella sp. NPDC050241]|uniref:hypothetical protein n=1 Tax=Kribbella sp. NPDC050241 TaxID=3364115 RepID=UPI00378C94D4
MSTSRRLGAIGVAVAMVLLAGGCAAGTHPGAAAVVGGTEISIGDVDETSRAVTNALGQDFTAGVTLSEMVNSVLVSKVSEERSISVSDAETAEAAKLVVGDEAAFQKFQANPVSRDFLNGVAQAAVATIKLGGGSGVNDPQAQQKQQNGMAVVKDASKNIDVSIAPRFGQWTDGAIDGKVSGSLSEESDQAKAKREAQEQQQQQQQGQG